MYKHDFTLNTAWLPYETPGHRHFNFKLFLTSVFYCFRFIYWHFGWWHLLFYFVFLLSLYIYFIYWCVFSLLFPVRSDCSQFISLYFFSTCRADISLSFIWCYVLWIYFKELIIVYFWFCFNIVCFVLYSAFIHLNCTDICKLWLIVWIKLSELWIF